MERLHENDTTPIMDLQRGDTPSGWVTDDCTRVGLMSIYNVGRVKHDWAETTTTGIRPVFSSAARQHLLEAQFDRAVSDLMNAGQQR